MKIKEYKVINTSSNISLAMYDHYCGLQNNCLVIHNKIFTNKDYIFYQNKIYDVKDNEKPNCLCDDIFHYASMIKKEIPSLIIDKKKLYKIPQTKEINFYYKAIIAYEHDIKHHEYVLLVAHDYQRFAVKINEMKGEDYLDFFRYKLMD